MVMSNSVLKATGLQVQLVLCARLSVRIFLPEQGGGRMHGGMLTSVTHLLGARPDARWLHKPSLIQPRHTPAGWALRSRFPGGPRAPRAQGFSTPRHGVLAGWFPLPVNFFSVTHDKFRDEVHARPEPRGS